MSINSISAAEMYSGELDRVFEAKSATAFFADNALRTKFVGAKTVIIPEIDFDGLADYDRADGFTNGSVTVSGTSYTMTISTELVVDGVMSDASKNPVMNKTVKAYVDRAKDFIVEQGTAEVKVNEGTDDEFVATWTYRKWNSGIAECWTASCRVISPFTTAWGSLYMSDKPFPQINYPFRFVGSVICNFDMAYLDSAAGYFFASSSGDTNINSHNPKIYAWSPNQYKNAREITARISVIGRWK